MPRRRSNRKKIADPSTAAMAEAGEQAPPCQLSDEKQQASGTPEKQNGCAPRAPLRGERASADKETLRRAHSHLNTATTTMSHTIITCQ
jgi:hypothetical protein